MFNSIYISIYKKKDTHWFIVWNDGLHKLVFEYCDSKTEKLRLAQELATILDGGDPILDDWEIDPEINDGEFAEMLEEFYTPVSIMNVFIQCLTML